MYSSYPYELYPGWDKLRSLNTLFRKKSTHFAGNLPVLIALTINLGVPPLLFVQVLYGHLFYSSAVTQAVPWILVIPALILAYYGSYIFVKNSGKHPAWSMTGLIASSVLLLYIGFMYVSNSTMTINPAAMQAHLENPGGMNLNLGDRSLWPRYLHFIVAALAVANLGIAVYASFSFRDNPGEKEAVIKNGLKNFAWFTLAQFIFGTLFWLTTPREVWMTFMGGNMVATILMVLSLLIIISMIVMAFRGKLWGTVWHALLVIIIMAVMRELMRFAYLDGIFKPSQLEKVNQYSPFILFLVVFVAGLFLLYYMIRLATDKNNKS
ncbi:MAG: hypothetical protein R2744_10925 [Bacteroidales bacterium]